MPRRYTRQVQNAKLNATLLSQDYESNDEEEEEEEEQFNKSKRDEADDIQIDTLKLIPHCAQPGLNKGLGADMPLLAYPSCALSVPYPYYVADRRTPIVEPCTVRTTAHNEFRAQLLQYQTAYEKRTKSMRQREKKLKNKIYDFNVYDMAEHIATQDCPFFRDSHDHHYTGGNLALMNYFDRKLALHTSDLRELHFSELTEEAEQLQPLYSASGIFDEFSSEIFELLPMRNFRVNHGNVFLTRCLNEIAIYELKQREEEFELICQCKYSSHEGPFISAAQDSNNASTLAIACQDRSIRFIDLAVEQDIGRRNVGLSKELQQGSNNWAQLLPVPQSSNCFYYACQAVLLSVDARCSSSEQQLNPCFAISAHAQQCENFSCITRSRNPNLLYVGSNHKLHCLDMRYLGKKLADRSVITWTHQMTYPPTFMDACMHEGSEYIALSSPLPSDQRLCELRGALATNSNAMSSPTLPYAPPSLEEALLDARLRGHVDVYADLGERIRSCITGLKFHTCESTTDDDAFAQLLTCNSIGDVYQQRLTLREEEEKEEDLRTGLHTVEVMHYYGDMVRKRVGRKKLNCTEVQNMAIMREIMKSEEEREKEKQEEEKVEPLDVIISYGFSESEEETELDDSEGNEEEKKERPKEKSPTKKAKEETKSKKQRRKSHRIQPRLPTETEKTPDKDEEEKDTNPKKKIKGINRGPWQKSAYQLRKYKDVITPRILSVWDIDDNYDFTRDVNFDMIDEKLNEDNPKPENLTDLWLQNLPPVPEVTKDRLEDIVPGTDLPTVYDAQHADFVEVTPEVVDLSEEMKVEADDTLGSGFRLQQHSTLGAGEFTVIESGYEPTQRTPQPPPAKRPKTKKHQAGF